MNRLFGTKKPPAPAPKVPSLAETSATLDTRSKALEAKVNECNKELNSLKQLMKTQKGVAYKNSQKKALMMLKRRKMYETQLNSVLNQQFNVDKVQFTTETIQQSIDTAATLKLAASAQKEQMAKVDVDKLEDLHDEMQEMMVEQEEVQEVLGRDYGVGGYNENELMDELDELDEEIVNEKIEGEASVPSYLPQQPKVVAKKDEDELAQIMNN